jgi:hypothetical protein
MVWSGLRELLSAPPFCSSAQMHRTHSGQWSKEWAEASSGAEWLPREEESITTLAHVTEMKGSGHLAWVKEGCREKRYSLLRADPVASRVGKTLASRFYQFRTGQSTYRATSGNVWKGRGRQMLVVVLKRRIRAVTNPGAHLFKHCHRWRDQQITMRRAIGKAIGGKRTSKNTAIWKRSGGRGVG